MSSHKHHGLHSVAFAILAFTVNITSYEAFRLPHLRPARTYHQYALYTTLDDEPFDGQLWDHSHLSTKLAQQRRQKLLRKLQNHTLPIADGSYMSKLSAQTQSKISQASQQLQRKENVQRSKSKLPLEDLLSDARRQALRSDLESLAHEADRREERIRKKLMELSTTRQDTKQSLGNMKMKKRKLKRRRDTMLGGMISGAAASLGALAVSAGAVDLNNERTFIPPIGVSKAYALDAPGKDQSSASTGFSLSDGFGGAGEKKTNNLEVQFDIPRKEKVSQRPPANSLEVQFDSPRKKISQRPPTPAPKVVVVDETESFSRKYRKRVPSPSLSVVMEESTPRKKEASKLPPETMVRFEKSPKKAPPPLSPAQEAYLRESRLAEAPLPPPDIPPTTPTQDASLRESTLAAAKPTLRQESKVEVVKDLKKQNDAALKTQTVAPKEIANKRYNTRSIEPQNTASTSMASLSLVIDNAKSFSVGVFVGTVALITNQKRKESSGDELGYSHSVATVEIPSDASIIPENAIDTEAVDYMGTSQGSYLDSLSSASAREAGFQSYIDSLSASGNVAPAPDVASFTSSDDESVVSGSSFTESQGVSYLESLGSSGTPSPNVDSSVAPSRQGVGWATQSKPWRNNDQKPGDTAYTQQMQE